MEGNLSEGCVSWIQSFFGSEFSDFFHGAESFPASQDFGILYKLAVVHEFDCGCFSFTIIGVLGGLPVGRKHRDHRGGFTKQVVTHRR